MHYVRAGKTSLMWDSGASVLKDQVYEDRDGHTSMGISEV